MVLYIWNQGFDCTFFDNNGDNEMPISFALKLWSRWQLNKGLFNKLIFIFYKVVKPQVHTWNYNPMLKKYYNCKWNGWAENNVANYDDVWYTT
jgi:hypothetical protein